MSIKRADQLMPYFGGKFALAPWIISHFPPHKTYVEPYGGAGAVLIQKPKSRAEVYNDLSGDVVNLFKVLRDPELRQKLVEDIEQTPYAREEFDATYEGDWHKLPPLYRARTLLLRMHMGFRGSGIKDVKTGFEVAVQDPSQTVRRWKGLPAKLARIGQRLEDVIIENKPAMYVTKRYDGEDVLHYLDPPYVHDTRTDDGDTYQFEMSDDEHRQMLEEIKTLKGFVVLSGYDHTLYSEVLNDWTQVTKTAGSMQGRLKTEVLYLNPQCVEARQVAAQTAGVLEWIT